MTGLSENEAPGLSEKETLLLVDVGDESFLMRVMLIVERQKVIINLMREYKERYLAMATIMPPPDQVSGKRLTHFLTEEQINTLSPLFIVLNDLIESIFEMSVENRVLIDKIASDYTEVMKSHFKKPKWMKIIPLPLPTLDV